MSKHVVSSAEFQKAFGRYRETALREPVTITNHGRESLVLIAAEEYRRLKALEQQALYAWELDEASLKALETDGPSQGVAFDHEVTS